MLYSLLRFSCRKMEAQSELGLNSTLKWLNAMPKGLSNDDFLEERERYGRSLFYLTQSLQVYIQSLPTASGSRLFGSVVERWIFNPAAWVQFPPNSRDIFQPNLLCFVPCNGFRVVRMDILYIATRTCLK